MKRSLLVFLIAVLPVFAADDLTLEQLVDKHIEALGGAQAWATIKTMRIEGTYTAFSETKPFVLLRKRPNLFYWDHHLGPNPMLTAYDGEKAWWVNPFYFRDRAAPMKIMEKQDRMTLRDIYIDPTFLNWEEKGYTLEMLGKQSFEGADYWVIGVTLPWGDKEEWFLDPESYLAFLRKGVGYEYGRSSPMNIFYDDYREVNGVLIPHLEEHEYHTRARTLEITKVNVNGDIPTEKFQMPAPDPKPKTEQ